MVKELKKNVRDILNEIKWRKKLEKAKIWYLHRGAPNDTKIISGNEIIVIGKSFFETGSSSIPYHRVFKIKYDEKIIFER
jgi:uncharacterized protein (UPF0248 family)